MHALGLDPSLRVNGLMGVCHCGYMTFQALSTILIMNHSRGKLDQLRRCFEVQFAAGRDLKPGQLGSMIQTLSNWQGRS
ncbi:hypothetical protein CMV_018387 [Castanea mollissima]|uniref:Uncharacterized protein n=1 Tax=Castanea mollissima TaxID=60419 RepID=A0A8J4VG79_9ROSI|nr:hypothetical protein CMV_018387 [Castanea mollissima]